MDTRTIRIVILSLMICADMGMGMKLEWNESNDYGHLDSPKNCTILSRAPLTLRVTAADSSVLHENLNFRARDFNVIEIRYVARDIPRVTNGQIFYGRRGMPFSENYHWRIPSLNGDGKEHLLRLEANDSTIAGGTGQWEDFGQVNALRLDLMDQPKGTLTIKSMALKKENLTQPLSAWNADNGFCNWEKHTNANLAFDENRNLIIHVTGPDSSIINRHLNLKTDHINCVEIIYQAFDTTLQTSGQLFYSSTDHFDENHMFPLPSLKADERTHTLRLLANENMLGTKGMQTWRNTRHLRAVRLDLVDQPQGTIKLKSIRFLKCQLPPPPDRREKYILHTHTFTRKNHTLQRTIVLPERPYYIWLDAYDTRQKGLHKVLSINGKRIRPLPGSPLNLTTGTWHAMGHVMGGKIRFSMPENAPVRTLFMTPDAKQKPNQFPQRSLWPPVRSEIPQTPPDRRPTDRPYFTGMMISDPRDAGHGTFYCLKKFNLEKLPVKTLLQLTADDRFTCYLNRQKVAAKQVPDGWREPVVCHDITGKLRRGENVLAVIYENTGMAGGLLLELDMEHDHGMIQKIVSDRSWKSSDKLPSDKWLLGLEDHNFMTMQETPPPPATPWSVILPFQDIRRPLNIKLARPGQDVTVRRGHVMAIQDCVTATLPQTCTVELTIRSNRNQIVRQERLKAKTKPMDGHLTQILFNIPPITYLSDETYLLSYDIQGYRFEPKNTRKIRLLGSSEKLPNITSEITREGTRTMLKINGKPAWFMMGDLNNKFTQSGMEKVPMPLRGIWTNNSNPNRSWWIAENQIQFDRVEAIFESILQQDPQVKLIPFVNLTPGPWFRKSHPAEESAFQDGTLYGDGNSTPSYASRIFRRQARQALQQFIRHFENSRFAAHIAGYAIVGGFDGEWHGWACHQSAGLGKLMDYSQPMKQAFAHYMRQTYGMEHAAIPTLRQRLQRTQGQFLDPETQLTTIAFTQCNSHVITDMLLDFGKTAKQTCPNKIIGTYNGYVMEYCNMRYSMQMGGSLEFERLLASPYFDFFMSPQSYGLRALGDCGEGMLPSQAVLNASKLYLTEDDTRPFTLPDTQGFFQTVNRTLHAQEMRRNMARSLIRHEGMCFYPINRGDELNHPDMISDFRIFKRLGEYDVQHPDACANNTRVAVVISHDAMKYMAFEKEYTTSERIPVYDVKGNPGFITLPSMRLMGELIYYQRREYAKIGAPVDYLLPKDITKENLNKYRLWIFPNLFSYDKDLYGRIELARQHEVSLLFLYAPGYFYKDTCSAENMTKLTGIGFSRKKQAANPQIIATRLDMPPYAQNAYDILGKNDILFPLFFAEDSQATVLGTYMAGNQPAFVCKKTNRAKSYFYGAQTIPAGILRSLAKEAKIHIYNHDSDVLYANKGFVAVHVAFAGRKRIDLTEPAEVIDVFTGRHVAKKSDSFSFNAEVNRTYLFALNPTDTLKTWLKRRVAARR